MDPACIRHTDLPGTTRLFADFTYHFDRVARFYRHDPHHPDSLRAAAAEVVYPDDRRAAMVRALVRQNGDSDALRRLAEPGTVAIVTGQQVGLFSGPAYTIYKAVTAACVAREMTERGIPAVPVFWLATEDHDFEEVNHVWTFDGAHQPLKLSVDAPLEIVGRQRPVGGITIEHPPLDQLSASLAGFPHGEEVTAMVRDAYLPGVTMGAGFHALLKKLLAKLNLLFLDPLDPAIRNISAPIVSEALEAAPELKARLVERNRELEAAGYHAQVHIEEKTSLFFLLDKGERVPLRRKDSDYGDLRDRAAEVSPNALLRPVVQDYLLPTAAYIGGPAELAYLAQSQVIYDRLLGRMPVVMSRSSFTLLEPRAAKLLQRYRMTVAEAFVDEEALRARIAGMLAPESMTAAFTDTWVHTEAAMDKLRAELSRFDPTLAAALDNSRAKILYQLMKTKRKIERELLQRDQRAAGDAQYLGNLLYPHRHLQERFYSILPFVAEHGLDLIDRLYDAARVECPDHRVMAI
jgi:bacillithiol biosynthesis cysteine-adding enzyme BshC